MSQKIELSADNQKIVGYFYEPKDSPKSVALLFLHGWTGRSNDHAAEFLATKGFWVLTIQMRGHGESDGDIKTVGALDSLKDAEAAYDFLSNNTPKDVKIVAVGNSYGSYISILLSEHKSLVGMSLRVPAAYPDFTISLPKWGMGHDNLEVDAWRRKPHDFVGNKAFTLLHNFAGNIQIIEAGKDEIIPSQTVENYRNSVSDPKKLDYHFMKDWPHSLSGDKVRNEQFKKALLDWLDKAIIEA